MDLPNGEPKDLTYFVLQSPRLGAVEEKPPVNIACGIVDESKRDTCAVWFEINGTYYPYLGFLFPGKHIRDELKEELILVEVNRKSKPASKIRGYVDLSMIEPKDIPRVSDPSKLDAKEEDNSDEEIAVVCGAKETEQPTEDQIDAEVTETERRRLLLEELAETDDQIRNDDGGQDDLDNYFAQKYDRDDEIDEEEDADYEDTSFSEVFKNAPYRFRIKLGERGTTVCFFQKKASVGHFVLRAVKCIFKKEQKPAKKSVKK
jgi:hypothetical protein